MTSEPFDDKFGIKAPSWRAWFLAGACLAALLATGAAHADPNPMTTPAMTGPLAANPNPFSIDLPPWLGDGGKVCVTGAVSGLGFVQDHVAPGDHSSWADVDNGQVFVQKTDGWLQFYIQAGMYSLPDLGVAYIKSSSIPSLTYGVVPQAFVKIAPADNFNIMVGKLPTLIGAEYTWSFENMNIERGLLWNQENAVNQGVQANYTAGPVAFALSWNDGMYSDRFSWLSGSVTWTIDSENVLAFVAGGNLATTHYSSFANPLYLNNSDIYNLIYTHTAGPWIVQPYLQYTYVKEDDSIGAFHSASTFGAALLVSYAFDDNWKLTGRAEYISSNGSLSDGAPSLIYGPGSKAWSLTITPTYQWKTWYARLEASYVGASDTTPGFALGPKFSDTSQSRALLEIGLLF